MRPIHKRADGLYLRCVGLLLFLAACAWCGVGLSARLRPAAVETFTAAQAESPGAPRLRGLCLRREEALSLPASAVLLVGDGERIARNAPLARLADGSPVTARESALYYADSDGLESLRASQLTELSPAALRRLAESVTPGPEGVRGRLVYDNIWYYAALAPDAAYETRACRLRFAGFTEWLPAHLVKVGECEDGQRALLFRLSRGGEYLKLRETDAELLQ